LKPKGARRLAMELKDLAYAYGFKSTQNRETNFASTNFQLLKNHAQKI